MLTGETALQFVISMKPAVPMSQEKPCTFPSNSELMRWLRDGAVLINNARIKPEAEIDFPVTSLVFFPKSATRRCTIF